MGSFRHHRLWGSVLALIASVAVYKVWHLRWRGWVDDSKVHALVYRPVVLRNSIPHLCEDSDTVSRPFTQGLLFSGDDLVLETSGLHGKSYLREFSLSTGVTVRLVKLGGSLFAEGAALVVEPSSLRVFVMVLTYTDGMILLYDYESFTLKQSYSLVYVGFGLASNYHYSESDLSAFVKRQRVWLTTGTAEVFCLELRDSFADGPPRVSRVVRTTLNGAPLPNLNELEYLPSRDTLLANVWPLSYIVEVDYHSGACVSVWDFGALVASQRGDVDVLNGIACSGRGLCVITGKFWSLLYRVSFSKLELLSDDHSRKIIELLGQNVLPV